MCRTADIGIAGRAEHVLPRLNDELDRAGPAQVPRREDIAALKAEAARGLAFLERQLAFLRAIRDALGEAGIFVAELTQVGYVSRFAFPVYRPPSYLFPSSQRNTAPCDAT